jgi:TolB protein
LKRKFIILAAFAAFLIVPQLALATVSGENGRIAFVRDGDIWTVNRAGTKQIHVTTGSVRDDDPSWSPNGKWIAFTRYRAHGADIYRVRTDGGSLDRVVAGAEPAWAPDGRRLTFRDRDGNAIWTVSLDGTGKRSVTGAVDLPCDEEGIDSEAECVLTHPSWGPFGKRIAFSWQYAIDDGAVMASTTARGATDYLDLGQGWLQDFSPDGQWVMYTDHWFGGNPHDFAQLGLVKWNGDDHHDVFTISPSDDFENDMTGSWSPNGLRFVVGSPAQGIRTMDPDGANVRFLAVGDNPSWQPLP